MIPLFDYQHIKAALMIAIDLAKDVGTDGDQQRIAYALRLLELQDMTPVPSAYMQEQCELYGCD